MSRSGRPKVGAATSPTFASFFSALHPGRAPFPWQIRLASEVLTNGWPGLLDLPTGVGKTSALDVALYCLAFAPDRLPRRTLLVVDRRIVVDQGARHARQMLQALHSATDGPLRTVADALRRLFNATEDDQPFAVAVMRGGMPRDNDWAKRPDQPVLGVSTVDQVGSRLLFRGYGVGPMSASIHAGLLANDTLILLDEVHLAKPFAQTLHAITSRYQRSVKGLPDRFAVVQMSATPGTGHGGTGTSFRLGEEDYRDATLAQRLSAKKMARPVAIKVSGDEVKKREVLAQRAVTEALALQVEGARVVGLVVNRVDTARLALQLLKAHGKTTDVVLVTGRMRAIDRDAVVRNTLLPRAGADRIRSDTERRLVVVATQCIEAGADLDFDGLVTECASLDALRQRFGRVDRRGDLKQTRSIILGRSDALTDDADDPIYGRALAATWRWLNAAAVAGEIDFGIGGLPSSVNGDGTPRVDLLASSLDAPVMLPAHLDAWAQTSPRPDPDPDVSLWLHGPEKAVGDVQILWRVGAAYAEDGLEPLIERLTAVRPSSLETVTVPLGAARRWLAGTSSSAIADVVAGDAEGSEDDDRRGRRDSAEAIPVAFRWKGEDSEWVTSADLRPGDVLVVDTTRGGLAANSFDPESTESVVDLGDLAQLRGRGVASLRLLPETLKMWSLELAVAPPMPLDDEAPAELRERVMEWLAALPVSAPTGFVGTEADWKAERKAITSRRMRVQVVAGTLLVTAVVAKADLPVEPESSDALTEDDASSFRQVEVTLKKHSTDVREFAEKFSKAVGFDAAIVSDVTLAAWLHDVGKADPRFQRWLVGGSEIRAAGLSELLAKSALAAGNAVERRVARTRAKYPLGYRHELLSLDLIKGQESILANAHDRDLVLHLVASHHGWCRPFAPPIDHPEELAVELQHGNDRLTGGTRHRLARLDSGVSDRFWSLVERYGWWGLAWLEAVMRLADHRASEKEAEGAQ